MHIGASLKMVYCGWSVTSITCVSLVGIPQICTKSNNLYLDPSGLSKFHQEPSPQTVPAGGAARFECQIEGVPTPVITWEKDKVAVSEEPRWAFFTICAVVALWRNSNPILFFVSGWERLHILSCIQDDFPDATSLLFNQTSQTIFSCH